MNINKSDLIMIASLISALMNESRWIAPSIALAAFLAIRTLRRADRKDDRQIAAAMCIYAGAMIGSMAFGHLLAVSLGLGTGALRGAPGVLYVIGLTLAIPSWWVFAHGRALANNNAVIGRHTVASNGALALALLAVGLLNLPLAIPAILTIGFASVSSSVIRRTLAVLTVAVALLLFVGSAVFFVSGQSFEEFGGMEAPTLEM